MLQILGFGGLESHWLLVLVERLACKVCVFHHVLVHRVLVPSRRWLGRECISQVRLLSLLVFNCLLSVELLINTWHGHSRATATTCRVVFILHLCGLIVLVLSWHGGCDVALEEDSDLLAVGCLGKSVGLRVGLLGVARQTQVTSLLHNGGFILSVKLVSTLLWNWRLRRIKCH